MGLPEITVIFKTKGLTAIKRSERGIVACILKDDTEGGQELNVYESVLDVDYTHWTERNYEYLKLIYQGGPYRVIVVRQATTEGSYNKALKLLKNLRWNYLTIPSLQAADLTVVSAWIKEERQKEQKTFKAVLPNCPADHEGIINFTTDKITTSDGENKFQYSRAEYCARIAGILAGISLARSVTYFDLLDIISADVPDDPDDRVDAGELILIYDGEDYQIGRGVNSFVSFTTEKGEEISKIKIVEGMDLVQDDIRITFKDHYVGKVRNDYDNKQAWHAAVNSYFRQMQGDVLDSSYNNESHIDINAQKEYLEGKGISTKDMTELELAMANTGSRVFTEAKVKFVDAMEDLTMVAHM